MWRVGSAGLRTLFRRRTTRRWIIGFATTYCLVKAIDAGISAVNYLFYRLQYKLSSSDFSNLISLYMALAFLSQVSSSTFSSKLIIELISAFYFSNPRKILDAARHDNHCPRPRPHHHRGLPQDIQLQCLGPLFRQLSLLPSLGCLHHIQVLSLQADWIQ